MENRCTSDKRWGGVKVVLILTIGSGNERLGLINGGGRSQMSWAYRVKYVPLDLQYERPRFNLGVYEMGYEAGVGQRSGHCGSLICRDQQLVVTKNFIQRGLMQLTKGVKLQSGLSDV